MSEPTVTLTLTATEAVALLVHAKFIGRTETLAAFERRSIRSIHDDLIAIVGNDIRYSTSDEVRNPIANGVYPKLSGALDYLRVEPAQEGATYYVVTAAYEFADVRMTLCNYPLGKVCKYAFLTGGHAEFPSREEAQSAVLSWINHYTDRRSLGNAVNRFSDFRVEERTTAATPARIVRAEGC